MWPLILFGSGQGESERGFLSSEAGKAPADWGTPGLRWFACGWQRVGLVLTSRTGNLHYVASYSKGTGNGFKSGAL